MLPLSGSTHDPITGESLVRVSPPEHAHAKSLESLLKTYPFTDAIEAVVAEKKIQCKPMARSARAAVRIAAALARDGKISPAQAIGRVHLTQFLSLLGRRLNLADSKDLKPLGTGLGAAVGADAGIVALNANEALKLAGVGKDVVLVVSKTTPEDMAALKVVKAIVTYVGGYTSHAAVVARQMGKPCVVDVKMPSLATGQPVTVDGSTGTVFSGIGAFEEGKVDDDILTLLKAADKAAKLKVFANADTPEDVKVARENGAQGIGLCRTEHTFFTEAGTLAMRQLILVNGTGKTVAIARIEQLQYEHFVKFFKELGSLPTTIRLLDPPLHEFLPQLEDKEAIKALAKAMKLSVKAVVERVASLQEENPMLGHRGVRLAVTMTGLYEAQARAIIRAATETAYSGELGIMIPLVVDVGEMRHIVDAVRKAVITASKLGGAPPCKITYGAMLETPRACLLTEKLANHCDFFSFGTNDLTQTTWALSRDDGSRFMGDYAAKDLFTDPFVTLDFEGVGALMSHAVQALGDKRSKIKIGICGEHGGDPASIAFCHALGLDYVSCSPPRLLAARLACGHAAVKPDETLAPFEMDLPEDMTKFKAPPPAHPALDAPPPVAAQVGGISIDNLTLTLKPAPQAAVPAPAYYAVGNTKSGKSVPLKPVSFTKATLAPAITLPPTGSVTFVPTAPVPIPSATTTFEPITTYAETGTPNWVQNAAPAKAEDLASAIAYMASDMSKATMPIAGKKVTANSVLGTQKASGVVVGYVTSANYQGVVVLVMDDPALGHDGKGLKNSIKWLIKPGPQQKIFYAPISQISTV